MASRRWIVAALAVALVGVAGFVFADAGNGQQSTKLLPLSGGKSHVGSVAVVSEDIDGNATTTATETTSRTAASPLAPSNDECSGAIAIPSGGLFPVTTAPVSLFDATPQGSDDPIFSCATTDQTVWYSFTPVTTGAYTFQTCGSLTGSTVYDTVLAVFASTGGACPNGASLACNDTGAGCAATIPGAPYVDQSKLSLVLNAGDTYFIVAGHWSGDVGGVIPGYDQVAIRVDLSPTPLNDTCSRPTPLALNRVVNGTTAGANDDYQTPDEFTCYSGVGQTRTQAPGRDVVFSFTAPADGSYSVRYVQDNSSADLRTQDPVLYATSTCPASGLVNCLKGANRMLPSTGQNRSEELDCLPMTSGQTIYVFFDDAIAGNGGGEFGLEVTNCHRETEPNDTTATANGYACYTTGATGVLGDVDFFDMGTPPAGSKVFAALDAVATNNNDFEMRVTTSTDTLQYDDNDGTSQIGSNAPVIGGAPTTGEQTFVRVNHKTSGSPAEPYHLYSIVQTGTPQAEVDDESDGLGNASFATANVITGGGYILGTHAYATDFDCYSFIAQEGDDISMFSDNNPDRHVGGVVNTWPILYDMFGNPPTRTRFTGQVTRNDLTASPGTLTGTTPSIVSEFWDYRARYTGAYFVCYYPDAASGDYPLPYAGSIALNCGPIPSATSRTTDVSVTKTVTTDGDLVHYAINITNNGNDIAQNVRLVDDVPPELFPLSLSVNGDGFDGNNTECYTLPTWGTNPDAPIDCTNFAVNPGQTVTYVLEARINPCTPAGGTISNTATITTASIDPDPSNNSATASIPGPAVYNGVCTDNNQCTGDDHCEGLVCTGTNTTDPCSDNNACTTNDTCDGNGACVPGAPLNCDDQSVCTTDSCDARSGCVHDNTPALQCNDGLPCTSDLCDPVGGCYFPAAPAGVVCDDFSVCTTNDACDGLGSCVGQSVCNDGNPCTDDYYDEFDNCRCDFLPAYEGQPCEDGNACTAGDACNANALCVPGTAAPNCDDNNPCTNDSCDPATGCVNTPISCDDNNACTTDSCDPASGCVYTPVVCNDGNACTTDSCDPASGCSATPVVCDDGNVCNGVESCDPASGCVAGTPIVCNDGNACTADSCNPASGCVATPIVCNDGNTCTDDSCDPATGCVYTNNTTNDPKSKGWYKGLCQNPHSGDSLTDADAVCVGNLTATFAGISHVSEICDVLMPSQPNNDSCGKAEDQLMTLALNVCKHRVCPSQGIDSSCGSNSSVGQSLAMSDAIFANPARTTAECNQAECMDKEINNGHALELDSLTLSREAGSVRLNWTAPILDDGTGTPKGYKIWRRAMGSTAPFVQVGATTGVTYLDGNAGTGMWQYLLTVVN